MFRIFRLIYTTVLAEHRPKALRVLALMTLSSLVQVLGIVSVMPFLLVLADPALIQETDILRRVREMLGLSTAQQFQIVLGMVTFGMLLASTVLRSLAFYAQHSFVQQQRVTLGGRIMAGYLAQPYPYFVEHSRSELAKTLTQETNQFIDRAMVPAASVVNHALQMVTLVCMLVVLDPVVTFVMALILGGTYSIVYRLTRPHLLRSGEARHAAELQRIQSVWETLSGIKPIKLAGHEETFLQRYLTPSKVVSRSLATVALMQTLPRYVIETIAFGGIVLLALVLSVRAAASGEITGSGVLPFLAVYAFAGYRMMPALQLIYSGLANIRYISPTIENITTLLGQLEAQPAIAAPPSPLPVTKAIRLDQISYHHNAEEARGVDDISLQIPVGSSLGIVGASGAGKTTLVDVFLGLLQPKAGQLVVDDVAIGPDLVRRWQQSLGYVPQEIFLANRSVTDNIAFGVAAEQVDHTRLQACARVAQIHDVIVDELPQGYDTVIGDRALRLSGGQRQRVGIARALYHDPDVLVFDEATNALDPVTESRLLEALESHTARKTRIVIAHRLSSVVGCDQIAVLNAGRLADLGTYADLRARSPIFQELLRADAQNQPTE